MPALGQKRTSSSFDHLISLREERRWDCHAQRFSRFEIDYHLIFCWRLYREVGWLLSLKDPINISSGTSALIDHIGSEGHQAALYGHVAERIDGGQFVLRRKFYNQVTRN